MWLSLITLLILTSFIQVSACSCGSIANPITTGGPIITIPAYTLEQGQLVIGSAMQVQGLNEISSSRLRNYGRSGEHTHSQDGSMNILVNAAYGVTDNLTMLISYPYAFKYGLRSGEPDGSIHEQGDSIGFGDLTLQARYRFLDSGCSGIQAALITGIKMPTGQTNERDSEGYKLAADTQAGSGSWDPMMGLAVSKVWGPFSVSTNGLYRISTEGQDTIIGDIASYNLGFTYKPEGRLSELLPQTIMGHKLSYTGVLEFNGIWQEHLDYKGTIDDAHGGNTVFITPGLTVGIDNTLFASTAISFPIIDNRNGIQPETGMQLLFSLNYLL